MFAIRIRSNVASWLWTYGGRVQYFADYESAWHACAALAERSLSRHSYKIERVI